MRYITFAFGFPNICCQNQVEKAKQDDALSDLSNILGDLKSMAADMGGELDRSVVSHPPRVNYTFSIYIYSHYHLEASESRKWKTRL